jgi:hypothetical protein
LTRRSFSFSFSLSAFSFLLSPSRHDDASGSTARVSQCRARRASRGFDDGGAAAVDRS